jgi:hypothetical protein
MARVTNAQLVERIAALEAQLATARKAAAPTRKLSELRAEGAGGTCEVHGKTFATAAGYDWHMTHIKHYIKHS